MYFADNDIAPGCPDPKDVQWLRPEEIIKKLILDGNEELAKFPIEVFASGGDGASSNDVC
jgi:hypothetical protein